MNPFSARTHEQAVLELARQHPLLRARDLAPLAVPSVVLTRLVAVLRRLQRLVQLGLAGMRHASDLLACGRVEHDQRAAVARVQPDAIDEELGVRISHEKSIFPRVVRR